MSVKRHLQNPPMIVALIALGVALSGTGYAAVTLPRASVGTPQMKNAVVTTAKIKKGAVTTAKLANSAVTTAKVRDGSLMAADFAAGQIPVGPVGPVGPIGPIGPAGILAQNVVYRADFPLPDGGSVSAAGDGNVACGDPAHEVAIGGGANITDVTAADVNITGSGPRTGTVAAPTLPNSGDAFTVWRATAVNTAGATAATTLRVYIICAKK